MHILLPDNTTYDMNELPDQLEADANLSYSVLDYSNYQSPEGADFYFIPLIFLDVFPRPSADLQIGPYRIQMPLDWSIVIADKDLGYMEIMELRHLNDRSFDAFEYNGISSTIPNFLNIDIVNIYDNVTWNVPRLKHGHLLACPLTTGEKPPCVYFVKETNRLPESLDITKIFS